VLPPYKFLHGPHHEITEGSEVNCYGAVESDRAVNLLGLVLAGISGRIGAAGGPSVAVGQSQCVRRRDEFTRHGLHEISHRIYGPFEEDVLGLLRAIRHFTLGRFLVIQVQPPET
jgi:hypothetical protein